MGETVLRDGRRRRRPPSRRCPRPLAEGRLPSRTRGASPVFEGLGLHAPSGSAFPRRTRKAPGPCLVGVFPAEPDGAVPAAHPRSSLGCRFPPASPPAWHRRLVSFPPWPVFLKENTSCPPLPPLSPRPGAGVAGPPRRQASGGALRSRASGVLPGRHPGWRKGVSLRS